MSVVRSGRWSLMSSSSCRKWRPLTAAPRGYQVRYQVLAASLSTALRLARIATDIVSAWSIASTAACGSPSRALSCAVASSASILPRSASMFRFWRHSCAMVWKTIRLYWPYTAVDRETFWSNRPNSSVFSLNDADASSRRLVLSRVQVELRLKFFPEGTGGNGMLWSLAGCGVSYMPLELPRIGLRALEGPVSQLSA